MRKIKLISLNIEGDKHLNRVIPFLKKEMADIVCLQEVFKDDLKIFEKELEIQGNYFPTANIKEKNTNDINVRGLWGIAILTKIKPKIVKSVYYVGAKENIPNFISGQPNSVNRVIGSITVLIDNQEFNIATTHFTWSGRGEISKQQKKDFSVFIQALDKVGDCVLYGDLNIPRGNEIYSQLVNRFTDNIPQTITTTIDANLHKHGNIQLVVDHLLSSPAYKIHDVKIVDGVSDHKAVMGFVERVNNSE